MKKIKVVELFAGVGGFRLGLEAASKSFKTIWANQWEPSTKVQHAFDIYNKHFKNKSINVNKDIAKVIDEVPDHDLLVGGFPCQDYSVAQGNRAKGIEGKKGVLWWEIYKIIKQKKPKMILLENVNRLLSSPVQNRGRDFAIMVRSLNDLGYAVEWKSINAAEYGFAQKRKRVFIFAWRSNNLNIEKSFFSEQSILNRAFKNSEISNIKEIDISKNKYNDLANLSDKYNAGKFLTIGVSFNGFVLTTNYKATKHKEKKLKEILETKKENFKYLTKEQLKKAKFLKDTKKLVRTTKEGYKYNYSEGKMSFPENLDKPGRTLLTSEGGISRSSHYINANKGIRFLTPIEAERLNGFPDNWTEGKTERQRFFFMGNALIIGIIEKIGKEILKEIKNEKRFI